MRAIRLMLWCAMLAGSQLAHAQLKVGDKLPGHRNTIINFWATWCVPCAHELGVLAEASATHPELRVLCVSYEDSLPVAKYWKEHTALSRSRLEVISKDKYWSSQFFHQALPHNVWIDANGVISAITGGEEMTEAHISQFLSGNALMMNKKLEVPFDRSKPVHIPDSLLTFRSVFTGHLPGVELSGSVISPGQLGRPNMSRFYEFNTLIRQLFWDAWQMPAGSLNLDLLDIRTGDSSRFFWPGKEGTRAEWNRTHDYTYELRTAEKLPDSLFFPHVVSDLEMNLHVKTWREPQNRICRVITYRPNGAIKAASKDAPYTLGVVGHELRISGVPMDYLINWLPLYTFKTKIKEPYLNKTGITGLISATVDLGTDKGRYTDPAYLEQCLSEQLGLKFEVKMTLYPVLVIQDTP